MLWTRKGGAAGLLALLLAIAIDPPASAAAQVFVTLDGTVRSGATGEGVANVRVRIEETGQGATTGADGAFRIRHVRPGRYTLVASAHQSHSYRDGGCLYFTFAGRPPEDQREAYYRAIWDAGQRAVLAAGGALSHHHGVGLNRARFVPDALGAAFDVLVRVKAALDPNGILNPGKLGLPSRFGPVPW